MIVDEAITVVEAATWRALNEALDAYGKASTELESLKRGSVADSHIYDLAISALSNAWADVRTCWALQFGVNVPRHV